MKIKVFVGWDSREQEAYKACCNSIMLNTIPNHAVEIIPLRKDYLQWYNLHNRAKYYPDETMSTEFAFTRFLVPQLSNYEGWSLFCDCDMIFTRSLAELFEWRDEKCSVMCVQHDYVPKDTVKMDGQEQKVYPKKNWSSLMLFNNSHLFLSLGMEVVNRESASWLHEMKWADKIGELPLEWNWLVGEYDKPDFLPANIHYTLGCPFMDGYEDCDFADEYRKYVG